MYLARTVRLNNGVEFPIIGIGKKIDILSRWIDEDNLLLQVLLMYVSNVHLFKSGLNSRLHWETIFLKGLEHFFNNFNIHFLVHCTVTLCANAILENVQF